MSRRMAGFTLLEMLIALVIAGLAFACVLQTLATGLAASARARRENQACEIAENALTLVMANGATRLDERRALEGGFLRVVSVRPRPDLVRPSTQPGLTPYQIDVSVRWNDGGRSRSLTLSGLRLGTPP